ncbi:phosphate ABC transporter substrate-binding protein [Massilia sp. S19_KUP03_FR1]|uniref:phosphate ABC transporter substrate-binding protein n=1 Tax=Massilia sp. S19_KUP03_FR1 TaxID=3025503 RepID=UPI002FCD1E72
MPTFTFYRTTVAVALLASACLAASAEVLVVVSAKSPATALTQEQAADIFLGRSTTLPGAGAAVPIDQAEGAAVRDEFYQKTAGKSGAQLKAYWSKQIFSGKGQPPKAVADSAAVKAQLASNPNMVAYIDKAALDATVKPLLTIK